MNNYVNIIFIMDEWEIDAGKHLILELSNLSQSWTDWIVVQKPVFFIPDLLLKFKKRFYKFLRGNYKLRKINKIITLFTPKIPFHFKYWLTNKYLTRVDIYFFKKQIDGLLKKSYCGKKVILWIYMPKLLPVVKALKYDYLVYFIQDNICYDANTGEPIYPDIIIDEDIIKKSDLVISTSKYMFDYASLYNKNIYHVPNGNNYSILTNENSSNKTTELKDIKAPIIGYIGGIRCWIDFKLIIFLLESFKDYWIIFIGPVYSNAVKDIKVLQRYKNFMWIDFKEQHLLHEYLKRFNVGIIPFKINKFMEAVFPIKFYEYMSNGIPIVTTALPELSEFADIIGFSKTNDDFLDNCKSAIEGKYDKFKDVYFDLALKNSWNEKAKIINDILLKNINK